MRKVLYILGVLSDEDVAWLGANGTRVDLAAGDTLAVEGRDLVSISILLSGAAVVSVQGRELARLGAGDIVGEMSLIDERPPSATVTVAHNATVLRVAKSALNAKLETDLAFAARFYRALAIFLSQRMRETVGRLGFGPATDSHDPEELDPGVLDNVHMAGIRFLNILGQQMRPGG